MSFKLIWLESAAQTYNEIKRRAEISLRNRERKTKQKTSKTEGLFKQIVKCATLLAENPHHPGLHTHEYHSLEHPYSNEGKVFEAYVQNKTSGAYRLFWCYGPAKEEITVIAITPHP